MSATNSKMFSKNKKNDETSMVKNLIFGKYNRIPYAVHATFL
jgi:hypothetical protein